MARIDRDRSCARITASRLASRLLGSEDMAKAGAQRRVVKEKPEKGVKAAGKGEGSLRRWSEVLQELKDDLRKSQQLSDKDFSIRINAK